MLSYEDVPQSAQRPMSSTRRLPDNRVLLLPFLVLLLWGAPSPMHLMMLLVYGFLETPSIPHGSNGRGNRPR